MPRPTFLAACRRRALEVALGQPRIGLRFLDLNFARDEMIRCAAELGVDGAELFWIPGYEEIQPVLPPTLHGAIGEVFAGELLDVEFSAHQVIRLRAELRQLEASVCSSAGEAPFSH